MAELSISTCLFPLRTNCGFYRDTGTLSLIARIKEAALLYEHVILEGGEYSAVVGGSKSFSMVNYGEPTGYGRAIRPRGGRFTIGIRSESTGRGTLFADATTERHFFCEYLSIAETLRQEAGVSALPDWLELAVFQASQHTVSEVRDIAREDSERPGYWRRKSSSWLRDLVLQNLNYDLLLGATLGATASMDGYFRSLVSRKDSVESARGHLALRVLVPRLPELSWSQILDLREMNAIASFRQAICDIEENAKSKIEAGGDIREAIHLQAEVDLAEGWRPPSWLEYVGKTAIDIILGFLPPPISGMAAASSGLIEGEQRRRTWAAMFLRLRERTG